MNRAWDGYTGPLSDCPGELTGMDYEPADPHDGYDPDPLEPNTDLDDDALTAQR